MDRLQPYYPDKRVGRLAMIVILLATVAASLSSSGLCLWPMLGPSPAMATALGSPDTSGSSHTMYAGLFDWFKP
jgi:hypothetical protein